MKKLLLFSISLLLAPAAQALQFEVNDITYTTVGLESSLAVCPNQNQTLTGNLVIPSYITYQGISYPVLSVGYEAFVGCAHITSVTISEGITSIGESAFEGCLSLTSAWLPEGLTSIGASAFEWCSALSSLVIPSSVTSIGASAFTNCRGLRTITCNLESPLALDEECFKNADPFLSILFVPRGAKLAFKEAPVWSVFRNILEQGAASEYAVTLEKAGDLGYVIGWDVYDDVYKLSLEGPVNAEDVYTFRNKFPALRILDMRKATIVSGGGCYYNELGTTENQIGDCMFLEMALQSLVLPESITSIGKQAFAGCSELAALVLPEGLVSIGELAFEGCKRLATISIPSTVTTIAKDAFQLCDALCNYVVANDQQWFATIDGVLFSWDLDTLVAFPQARSSAYTMPEGVKVIGDYAFAACKYLPSLVIAQSVVAIGDYAFGCCAKLSEVTIPEGVVTIGAGAFQCCGIESVTIPSTVVSIGMYAFAWCSNLTTIHAHNATPPEIGIDGFTCVDKYGCTIFVPEGATKAYEVANKWRDFKDFMEVELTGLETLATEPLLFATERGAIVVKGVAAGGVITVCNLQGTELRRVCSEGEEQRVELPSGAIYIVTAGRRGTKIAL